MRFAADLVLLAAALYAILWGAPSRAEVKPDEFTARRAVAPYAPTAADAVIVAAVGDGVGDGPHGAQVAEMVAARRPGLFLYLGDVHDRSTQQEFTDFYAPTFGRLRDVTNPVPGNHEYATAGAAGYFAYWDNIPSYYSYDSSGWHFVALNSAGPEAGLQPGSAQYEWLKNDLDANTLPCTLVYYHHPRYSTRPNGGNAQLAQLWALLAQKGVDVALAGHDHVYQRWQPLDAGGNQAAGGVTAFVVGTGGHEVDASPAGDARVAAQHAVFGALFLDLAHDGLRYRFLDAAGRARDAGTLACSGVAADPPLHGAGAAVRLPIVGKVGNPAAGRAAAVQGDSRVR